jgi:dTDP-4-dehydrorhamnose reductase
LKSLRILLTGAAGQLGSDLRKVLSGHDVHAVGHDALDISDRSAVLDAVAAIRPDWVVNTAAFTDVDRAESVPDSAFAVNAQGAGHLAEAAATVGAAILQISTDYVFDGRKRTAYVEGDSPNPISVYGRSKYEGEGRVLESGAHACVLRTAWLYGRAGKNFVRSIQKAADAGGPIRVVADQVGSPTATADLAGAILEALEAGLTGLFHVVNAGACSRFELARSVVGDRVQVLPITTAEAGRPARRPANSALVSDRWSATGCSPLRPWQEALRAFLAPARAE